MGLNARVRASTRRNISVFFGDSLYSNVICDLHGIIISCADDAASKRFACVRVWLCMECAEVCASDTGRPVFYARRVSMLFIDFHSRICRKHDLKMQVS